MASSPHSNNQTEPAEIEQIITEFFAKSRHIILESRSPSSVSSRNFSGTQILSSPSSSSSSSSSFRPRDKWFNLALKDCPSALENFDLWHQSNLEPMVIDVILIQKPINFFDSNPSSPKSDHLSWKEKFPNSWNSGEDEFYPEIKKEKIIERWVVQYESKKSKNSSSGSKRNRGNNSKNSSSLYQKSVILLRSLYLIVKLLPAYKLFRDLNSSSQILSFTLAQRVSSFLEPFTRVEEVEMQTFCFAPLDTYCGRLCLSVLYRKTLPDLNSGLSTPTMSTQFIPDYVGSPTTDHIRSFHSLPLTKFQFDESFGRRHSWSYDIQKGYEHSVSPSPPPTYSYSHDLDIVSSYMRSPSPSLSPPNQYNDFRSPNTIFRSESAPVSIPRIPGVISHVIPSSPPRGTRLGPSQTKNLNNQMRLGNDQTGLRLEKMKPSRRDEIGNPNEANKSSSISPKVFSWSPRRFSSRETFDYSKFAPPFAVEKDYTSNPHPGPESFDEKGHLLEIGGVLPIIKSQNAVVGALVELLSTAPPLRQDFSSSIKLADSGEGGIHDSASNISLTGSGVQLVKTTAEALEEFQSYRDMKESLLKKGIRSQTSKTERDFEH